MAERQVLSMTHCSAAQGIRAVSKWERRKVNMAHTKRDREGQGPSKK